MKQFLLITGMHRSGTSFLARSLNLGGVYLGPLESLISHDWKFFEDNLRGHWESRKLFELTDKTLSQNNGSWDNIPQTIKISAKLANEIKKAIGEILDNPFTVTGFKDPRIILCLSSWKKCIPKNFVIVGIFRHPLKVAESLKKRNNFSYDKSLKLWETYNEKLLKSLEKHNGFLLNFDWPKGKLISEIQLILDKLGLDKNVNLDEWYTKELFLSDKSYDSKYGLEKTSLELYEKLKKRSEKNKKVIFQKPKLSKNDFNKIFHELHLINTNQGNYFKKIHIEKNVELTSLQKDFDKLEKSSKQIEHELQNKTKQLDFFKKEFDEREKWANAVDYERHDENKEIESIKKEFDEYTISSKQIEQELENKTTELDSLKKEFDERAYLSKKIEQELGNKTTELDSLKKESEERVDMVNQKGYELDKKNTKIQDLNLEINTKNTELNELQSKLYQVYNELEQIKHSIIFKMFKGTAKSVDKIFPPLTKRGKNVSLARSAYLTYKNEGLDVLMSASKQKFGVPKLKKIKRKPTKPLPEFLRNKTKKFILESQSLDFKIDQSLRDDLKFNSGNISSIDEHPKISIVILTYDQVELLKRNIDSLKSKSTYKNFEIIIVTNNTDPNSEMRKYLNSIGCKVFVYDKEYSFSKMNNLGASKSEGEFLLFLNDDVEVLSPNWLEAFLQIGLKKSVGAVGAKLLFPNGRLQEAGCIVWKRGNAWNYGRNENPEDPDFNYVRDVDYCSGACLFVKKQIFENLKGFDPKFHPAYSEDVDLCFSIKKHGFRVVYQPLACLIHHEGSTQGTDVRTGIKSYQVLNQKRFTEKWQQELNSHLDDCKENTFFERDRQNGINILYIDHYIPEPDKDSGSLRTFRILGILKHLGNRITFWPDNLSQTQPYTTELQQKGIEVIYGTKNFINFLEERKEFYDLVILSRPYVSAKFIDQIRSKMPNCIIIFETTDLHFLRMKRQRLLEKNDVSKKEVEKMHDLELSLMKKSDLTILTSKEEAKILHEEDESLKFILIPNINFSKENIQNFEDRQDMMFLGGFQHPPNIDSAEYLINEIFPIIRQKLPQTKLYVIGSNPPEKISKLASNDVIVTGYVKELDDNYENRKLMLSPVRFGAGIKGKITQSLARGLPVITSSLGAEGIDLVDGENCMIADTPADFAKKAVEVYENKDLWKKLSDNGLKISSKFSPEVHMDLISQLISKIS